MFNTTYFRLIYFIKQDNNYCKSQEDLNFLKQDNKDCNFIKQDNNDCKSQEDIMFNVIKCNTPEFQ